MNRQVLFIQGGGDGAYAEDAKLVESLRRELGDDYAVVYPQMPDEGSPDYDAWKAKISQELAALNGEIILIGHSVGGYILVKYLSEENDPQKPIIGIGIIAAPYPDGDENWHYEGFTLPEHFGANFPKGAKVFLYHSRDDQTIPFAHVSLYANEIPGAVVRQVSGGHQLGNDLSAVAADIKSL